MTIKQQGGIFGRNPTFNIATATQFVGPISGLATSAEALKSSATTGLMRVTGPATGQTRTMTVPDANFTAARTDAAQSFTGNQTLTDGNLIVANGKGIDFSATAGTGTSELFDDYEEGTWTPTVTAGSGSITSFSSSGTYTKVGRVVTISGFIKINNNGTGAGDLNVAGLPFTIGAQGGSGAVRSAGFGGHLVAIQAPNGGTAFSMFKYDNTYPVGTNSQFNLSFSYFV